MRSLRYAVGLLTLVVMLGVTANVRASDVYKWVDDKGVLNITDRLDQVPEPYYSMYAAEKKKRQEEAERLAQEAAARGETPAPKVKPPVKRPRPRRRTTGATSVLDQEAAARKKWQGLVLRWRAALQRATQELVAIDERIAEARSNPVLRHTPAGKLKIAKATQGREVIVGRLARARRMLLKDLPAQAKREGVPIRWLK